MKPQSNEMTCSHDEPVNAPEVVSMELLALVAGGLPYNVSGYPETGESTATGEMSLPYNVG